MRTEDLLAACLDAQDHGQSPAELLAALATPDQRAELVTLLNLAARLGRLAPPARSHTARLARAARLAAAIGGAPPHALRTLGWIL
ncbi:MAG TPA: hypothetical protein VM536_07120 [Chloroflexia bacterium]|nr:hypothetical protein [Chloroflexia bacterium]